MHTFRGSFSYISEFKTISKIIYEALIVFSSITKKERWKVHLGPLVGFGV
jgi:hypothetical protein